MLVHLQADGHGYHGDVIVNTRYIQRIESGGAVSYVYIEGRGQPYQVRETSDALWSRIAVAQEAGATA